MLRNLRNAFPVGKAKFNCLGYIKKASGIACWEQLNAPPVGQAFGLNLYLIQFEWLLRGDELAHIIPDFKAILGLNVLVVVLDVFLDPDVEVENVVLLDLIPWRILFPAGLFEGLICVRPWGLTSIAAHGCSSLVLHS